MKRMLTAIIPDIVVEYSVEIEKVPESIKSALLIGQKKSGNIDGTNALADWKDFIAQFKDKVTRDPRFSIVKIEDGKMNPGISKVVPLSKYFYLSIIDPETNEPDMEIIIDFRLSTHEATNIEDRSKHEANLAAELGVDTDFVRGQFIVNNKTCRNYIQAMRGVSESLEKAVEAYYESKNM